MDDGQHDDPIRLHTVVDQIRIRVHSCPPNVLSDWCLEVGPIADLIEHTLHVLSEQQRLASNYQSA